jgi:transposase-like protein
MIVDIKSPLSFFMEVQMSRPPGGTNRVHSQEFKFSIVQQVLEGTSPKQLGLQYDLCPRMIRVWVSRYQSNGVEGLGTRKPADPLTKYNGKKQWTEVERLTYELALAHREIAALKKARLKDGRDAPVKK